MSILDDTKRAQKGARALLWLLTESSSATFEQDLEAYTRADGIFGEDFLQILDRTKTLLPNLDSMENRDAYFSLPFEFQLAVVEYAIDCSNFDFLRSLQQETGDKRLKKQIARRLHELKTQGVTIAPKKRNAGVKLKAVVEPEPLTMLTESDGYGNRSVFYSLNGTQGGVRVLYVDESATVGVLEFEYTETSRSGFRDMAKSIRAKSDWEVFEVPQPIGYSFLLQAKKRNAMSGKPLPPQFSAIIEDLPVPETVPARSPVWDLIEPGQVDEVFADYVHSASLHRLTEFRNWYLPMDILQEVETRTKEIMESKVLISDQQKKDQLKLLVGETVDAYFDEPTRALWIRRIEDTAYLLAEHKKLTKEAILALAVARALEQPGRNASGIPFCEKLLSKLLAQPSTPPPDPEDPEKGEEGGGILVS